MRNLLILFIVFLSVFTCAQTQVFPQDYFRPPVDFRMLLSGTFGEFRSDHFHSGIDIKTGGVEGKPVYAIADGYVYRIKVSAGGFGKALYIAHPNGFVSVYGHLSKFKDNVGQYVVNEQYKRHSFEVDLFPSPETFPVSKGEAVALSGNTGSSAGPHLHFEIRDQATEHPVNPLLCGLQVKDDVPPVILGLKIYTLDPNSTIQGKNDTAVIAMEGRGTGYRLAGPDTVTLSGKIGFGLQSYDLLNDADNKNGIYTVELFRDGESCFKFTSTTFSFNETRYVNSLIDYAEYRTTGRRFMRTCIDPSNEFSGYEDVRNQGVLIFNDNDVHKMEFIVTDAAGNATNLLFFVKSEEITARQPYLPFPQKFDGYHFFYYLPNEFRADDISVEIPQGALYDNLVFRYSTSGKLKTTCAPLHHVHDQLTPLHKPITLSVRPDESARDLIDKLYIVLLDNGKTRAITSEYRDGFVTGKSGVFGSFSLMADTLKPVIRPVNFSGGKNLAGMSQLRVAVTDEESGILSYTGSMNGEWILMEYDAKNDLLIYNFDQYIQKGMNTFRLEVTDKKNNSRVYEAKLIY